MSDGKLERKYGGTTPKRGRPRIKMNNARSTSNELMPESRLRESILGKGRRRESVLHRHRDSE